MCRRVNVAGLRLLFLERAAYKGDLLLASSIVALGMSAVNRKLCLDHLYSVLYAKLHFPSGSLGFWCTVGRCCLCDQPEEKLWALNLGFPGQKHCIPVSAFSLLREGYPLCGPTWEGESIRKSEHGFFQALPIYLPVIHLCTLTALLYLHLSCECNCILSPLSLQNHCRW